MEPFTFDELDALCQIPEDRYAALAMQVQTEARQRHETLPLDLIDREVLRRWRAQEDV